MLGTLSRAGGEGGEGKMARVCERLGLGVLTKDHFVCRFGIGADRVRRKDWGLYPGPGGRTDVGKWPGRKGGQNYGQYLWLFG
jgi:hypothetical protein